MTNLKTFFRKVRRKISLRQRPVLHVGNGRILAKTRMGTRMYLDERDIVISPIVALEGYWEPEIGDYIVDRLKRGMTFVDVGANMGYFSCIAAAKVGVSGKVYAYEADPDVYPFLVDNLALNWHSDNVFTGNVAVWSERSTLTLHRRGKYKGNTSVGAIREEDLARTGDTSEEVSVESLPLDELIPAGTRPDLVKIDVEGAEPWVLRGATTLFERAPDMTMLVEWSPEQIRSCGGVPDELTATLKTLGRPVRLLEQGLRTVDTRDLASVRHGTLVVDGRETKTGTLSPNRRSGISK